MTIPRASSARPDSAKPASPIPKPDGWPGAWEYTSGAGKKGGENPPTPPAGFIMASQATAFKKHAEALADWTLSRIVVRMDVFGKTLADGKRITGHDVLTKELLIRHYRGLENIGAHLISPDNRCLCLVADVDAHDDKADPETNWQCVNLIVDTLKTFELFPLVCDSNGKGGYHVRTHFKKAVKSEVAYWLGQQIKSRLKVAGLPDVEIFPKQGAVNIDTPYGNWVRLPGKHPKREHWTRVFDPQKQQWLEGGPAVRAIIAVAGDETTELLKAFKAAQPALEAQKSKKPQGPANDRQPDEEEIRSALFHCPNNDLDFDPWIGRGFALNDWDQDRGLALWIEWSRQSSKHVEGECERRWASMGPGGGITAKSLFKLAYDAGWTWKPSTQAVLSGKPSSNGTGHQAQPDSPIINKRKAWISCHHNSKIWLAQNGLDGKIFYDRFHRMVYIDGKRLDDEIVIKLAGQIEKALRVPWGQEHVRSAMIDIAYDHQRSAIEDWLNPLQWDQVPRIDSFFEVAYGCKRQDYNAACSKVLFLSGVARAFDPGCKADVMPVLIGPQGIGKSFGMRALCPVPDWHTDDGIGNLNDRKATGEGLQGKWIVEFSEFTRINRSTLETIKAFVSRQFDHYRPSYGRTSKDFPRSCVFVGTTNDKYPLHDVENRRFMPVRCVQGDIPWIEANRDQLWAEACTRYKAGEKWWITDPALIKVCRQKQEAARLDDAWETILANGLAGIDTISAVQVAKIVGVEPEKLDRSTQTRLGLALDRLGFTRRRKRVGKLLTYEWIRRGVVPTCPF